MTKFTWTCDETGNGYKTMLESVTGYELQDPLLCAVDCLDQFLRDAAEYPEIEDISGAIKDLRKALAKLLNVTSSEQIGGSRVH